MKKNLFKKLLKNRGFSWLSPKVKLKSSGIEGKGLFAVKGIGKGEIVNICGGAIVTQQEYERLQKEYGEFLFDYATQIADGFYLLGGLAKNELEDDDFLNHSCDPNCGIKGQNVVVAMRSIKKGEELTIDYAMIDSDPEISFGCNCAKKLCRRLVKGSDWKIASLQKRYRGYFSWYIEDKIDKMSRRK